MTNKEVFNRNPDTGDLDKVMPPEHLKIATLRLWYSTNGNCFTKDVARFVGEIKQVDELITTLLDIGLISHMSDDIAGDGYDDFDKAGHYLWSVVHLDQIRDKPKEE
jgi:hypothetical protein